jgi:flagellar biosynthesis regulator FlbT
VPPRVLITRLPEFQLAPVLAAILLSRQPDPLIQSDEIDEALETARELIARSKPVRRAQPAAKPAVSKKQSAKAAAPRKRGSQAKRGRRP